MPGGRQTLPLLGTGSYGGTVGGLLGEVPLAVHTHSLHGRDGVRHRDRVKERIGYVNRASSGTDKFIFNASKKATSEYAVSVGVSATAGSAMFGEVQASVNAEVRRSMEYGLTFGGQKSVPPRTAATAKLGFRRTIADGKSYYLQPDGCDKTNVNAATLKAPWEKAWVVDLEAL